MNDTDHQLLERFLSTGDQPSFAELVRRHLGLVHSAAFRITNRAVLAEEVSQIVFTKLARLGSAKPGLLLVAWLHRTTRSTAIDMVRSETRRSKREEIAASLAMNETSIPWERIAPVLDQVIDGLSPDERHVVLCRYFEGQSHAEIARTLGVSEDALRMRVSRSLEKIRVLLQQRGITTTASALALVLPANAMVAPVPAGLAASIAATAVASFSPSLALVQIGIITMTKKTALIASTVLLLAGAGTAVVIATKPKDPAIASSSLTASRSGDPTAENSSDPRNFKTNERPSQKKELTAAENELVSKYGEARVKLAKRLTGSLLHLFGEDGILSLTEVMSSDTKNQHLTNLTTQLSLTEEQVEKATEIYEEMQANHDADYRSAIADLASDSTAFTETLLAGDAFKRGKISESECQSIRSKFKPKITNFGQAMTQNSVGQDLSALVVQEQFVSELKSALDPAQSQMLDELIANAPPVAEEASGPQISLNMEEPKTLEEIDTEVTTVNKMVNDVKSVIDGMKSLQPPAGAE